MKKLIALVAGATLLAGCGGDKPVTQEDLLHHRFVLVSENGNKVEQEVSPYIEFNEGLMVNGKMCNSFFGKVTLEDSKLTSAGLASTRMLCSDEQLNKLDATIGEVFKDGAKVTLENDQLTLKTDKYELVYKLSDYMN